MSARAAITPELDATTLEIERAERELASLLERSQRLHYAHMEHNPKTCLVCFSA
ncbi:hypothetical protein [Nocardioides montaniterrae]